MNKKLFIAIVSILFTANAFAQQQKIVWDLSAKDTADQSSVLRQINNVLTAAADTKIEVVFHGEAITTLAKDQTFFAAKIADYTAKGVIFAACNNSMKRKGIKAEELLPGVVVVPVSILEMAKKQQEGWSYIKAGH
ncbi:MAG: DsrE family protein [Chitinophagaceae bacterium]